jgi:hypothetical protein
MKKLFPVSAFTAVEIGGLIFTGLPAGDEEIFGRHRILAVATGYLCNFAPSCRFSSTQIQARLVNV